jgi:hypothetical protein
LKIKSIYDAVNFKKSITNHTNFLHIINPVIPDSKYLKIKKANDEILGHKKFGRDFAF